MIKCIIDSVRVSLTNQQRLVVLKDVERELFLPIWIGLYEAEAITIALQDIEIARPQTHDLMTSLISALDGKLLHIEVSEMKDDVFYANLVIEQGGKLKSIDCRPSDAIALAARTGVDILVSEEVMKLAAIEPGRDEESGGTDEDGEEVDKDDLDVFKDFLNTLDEKPGESDSTDNEPEAPK